MKKKIFAVILSVILCMSCGVVVFAEDDASSAGFDMESILASDIAQQVLAMDGMTDITNIIIDVVLSAGSIDIQAMGQEKATAFIQNIIGFVGKELQDTVTNVDAFATNPIDIVDRLFDLEINETIEDTKEPENTDDDLVINFGDVDGDGVINAADARLILRRSAELIVFTDEQDYRADINKDGEVTAADARIVLRISAELEEIDAYL